MPAETVYASITGLMVSSRWRLPQFWRHAIPSLARAQRAPGLIRAETRILGACTTP